MATLLVYADTYFFTYMYVQLNTIGYIDVGDGCWRVNGDEMCCRHPLVSNIYVVIQFF